MQCDAALKALIQQHLRAFSVEVGVRELQHAAAVAVAITRAMPRGARKRR